MHTAKNLILILGSSRSGTTWVGKIFESHPNVLYRHEPDIGLRTDHLPPMCNDIDTYRDAAHTYLSQLVNVRQIKTVGSPPIFDHPYRNPALSSLRKMYIRALAVGERVLPQLSKWDIPDFIGDAQPQIVIKSVSALGRAGVFAAALPDSHIVHIIRHPCGHVGSVLRGRQLGKLGEFPLGFEQADTALEYDLTQEKLAAMPVIEQAAWRWVVINHKAMRDTHGNPKVMQLRYEDLCAAPIEVSKRLMEFTGMNWAPETDEFLQSSTRSDKTETFFTVFRDPLAAAQKWQQELTPEQIDTIMNIVRDTPPGKLFE